MRNIIKNVVMRNIVAVRQQKAKPGLKDMIMAFLKVQYKRNEKIREKIKEKVVNVYER